MRQTYLLLGVLAAAIGCTSDGVDPLSLPIEEPGPWRVGYRTWETSYASPGAETPRTVAVHVWYPTEDTDGSHPRYAGLLVDGDTIIDATPAAPAYEAGYPVAAHSHGHQGFAEGAFRMHRHFASHGWVAVSVSHRGDLLTDGSDANAQPLAHWAERPLDVTTALDSVAALPDSDPLSRAHTDRVLLTGHSRGAYTVWASGGAHYDLEHIDEACGQDEFERPCTDGEVAAFTTGFRDARVVAGIPMAGNGHPELFGRAEGMNDAEIPLLLLTAEADPVGAEALRDEVSPPHGLLWVELAEGCHELFNLGCGAEQDALGFPLVAGYTLAFGRRYVLGDESETIVALTNGAEVLSPRASVR